MDRPVVAQAEWPSDHRGADYCALRRGKRRLSLRFGYALGVYVVVCRGPNCRARGAMGLRKRLVKILRNDADVHLLGYSCFGQCDLGPNVAFYPEGVWYGHLVRPDDAERVVRHAACGEPLVDTPLILPEDERAEHLRNISELVRTLERDRARGRHWWWPF
jgi:(2Fe-2S) ferredoxin